MIQYYIFRVLRLNPNSLLGGYFYYSLSFDFRLQRYNWKFC